MVLSTVAAGQSIASITPALPEINEVDRQYLTKLIRRTLEYRIRDGSLYKPNLVPPQLDSQECQVLVTLRQGGFARGIGVSQRDKIITAAREAAILALESAKVGGANRRRVLDQVRIEVQVLGEIVPFRSLKNWTEPGALDGFLTPGLDGVMLFLDEEQRWFTPAEMISKNVSLQDALRTLSKEVSLDPQVLNEARLSKFRALHWWESDDEGHITSLVRGLDVVDKNEVTPFAIKRAIERIGGYLVYRQLPNGRFAYEYEPASAGYSDSDSELAQSGATWAMAAFAKWGESESARRALRRAIRARRDAWVEFPAAHGAFLTEPDNQNRLGVTAQLCLALQAAPEPQRYQAGRKSLLDAMLWLQQADGSILPAFPPAHKFDTQDRYPGQALLAFANAYEREPSQRLLDAIDSSFEFYRHRFKQHHPPAMVPWFSQTYGKMARLIRKRTYADFVFEMTDLTLKYQLTPENCTAPELWGAIEAPGIFSAGASTALFLHGLCDAAETARFFDDQDRYERYKTACMQAARFVLQLEFKPSECYFIKSPADVVGGIRTSPTEVNLSISSSKNALIGLIKLDRLLKDDPS